MKSSSPVARTRRRVCGYGRHDEGRQIVVLEDGVADVLNCRDRRCVVDRGDADPANCDDAAGMPGSLPYRSGPAGGRRTAVRAGLRPGCRRRRPAGRAARMRAAVVASCAPMMRSASGAAASIEAGGAHASAACIDERTSGGFAQSPGAAANHDDAMTTREPGTTACYPPDVLTCASALSSAMRFCVSTRYSLFSNSLDQLLEVGQRLGLRA